MKDRVSFQQFLGLGLDGIIPDANTLSLLREQLDTRKNLSRLGP